MTVILQDPVGPRDPSSGHAFPDPNPEATAEPLRSPRTLAAELLAGQRVGKTVGGIPFDSGVSPVVSDGSARPIGGFGPRRSVRPFMRPWSEAEVFFEDPPTRIEGFFSSEPSESV